MLTILELTMRPGNGILKITKAAKRITATNQASLLGIRSRIRSCKEKVWHIVWEAA
jgi:hypothetical protein